MDLQDETAYNRTYKGGETHGNQIHIYITVFFILLALREDLLCYRIGNRLAAAGILTGIALKLFFVMELTGAQIALGVILPVVILWPVFCLRGIGAGDIKLFSVIGCLNGGMSVICCIFFSFFLAALFSIAGLLMHRQLSGCIKNCFQYLKSAAICASGLVLSKGGSNIRKAAAGIPASGIAKASKEDMPTDIAGKMIFCREALETAPGNKGPKGHIIHFSAAILGGYLMFLAVELCWI